MKTSSWQNINASCHDCSACSSGILCHGTHNIPPPLHLPFSLVSCLTRLKKVPMMHGATTSTVSSATTPVTNVPFAESAASNQVCPFILASSIFSCWAFSSGPQTLQLVLHMEILPNMLSDKYFGIFIK